LASRSNNGVRAGIGCSRIRWPSGIPLGPSFSGTSNLIFARSRTPGERDPL
jgi:hypothetical protein